MAGTSFRIETRPTFRDLKGRFARAEADLIRIRRDELRVEGRIIVRIAQRKLSERLAKYGPQGMEKGIRFNTQQRGNDIHLNVTAPGHARPHRIAPRFASGLFFFFGKIGMNLAVPKHGGFKTYVRKNTMVSGKGYVDHPGGTLKPLMTPIMESAKDEWLRSRGRMVLRRISTRYVEGLTQ